VPNFGDRYWDYAMYDARTDEFSNLGKQYSSRPGFYLIVGPNWKDKVPEGIIDIIPSRTELAIIVPRIFVNATPSDKATAKPLINQVVMYPLSQFDRKMKTIDWQKVPAFPAPLTKDGETRWVDPEIFFDELPYILQAVPPLPGEEALYWWFAQ